MDYVNFKIPLWSKYARSMKSFLEHYSYNHSSYQSANHKSAISIPFNKVTVQGHYAFLPVALHGVVWIPEKTGPESDLLAKSPMDSKHPSHFGWLKVRADD